MRVPCEISPGPEVCPGRIAFTLHVGGGGPVRRFTRPHLGNDGKKVAGVMRHEVELTEDQIAELRSSGYRVVDPDAATSNESTAPKRRRKAKG